MYCEAALPKDKFFMTRPSLLDSAVSSISNPEQVWYLARLTAYRDAAHIFQEVESCDSQDDQAKVKLALDHIRACADKAWLDYVRLVARTPAERSAYLELGEPEHIRLNTEEGAPVAHWNSNNPSLAGVFGELLVAHNEAPHYHVSDPFKPLDLAALPPGTFTEPLRDSRHCAIAAMHELVTLLCRDIERIIQDNSPPATWKAMRKHSQFLKQGARISLTYLQHDHFHNWDPVLPITPSFQHAPHLIDQRAATTTAQQRIALHYTAQCFGRLLEEVESQSSDDAKHRVDSATAALQRVARDLEASLDLMNNAILGAARIDPESVVTLVVFRPINMPQPMFVAIPRDSLPEPTSIQRQGKPGAS